MGSRRRKLCRRKQKLINPGITTGALRSILGSPFNPGRMFAICARNTAMTLLRTAIRKSMDETDKEKADQILSEGVASAVAIMMTAEKLERGQIRSRAPTSTEQVGLKDYVNPFNFVQE